MPHLLGRDPQGCDAVGVRGGGVRARSQQQPEDGGVARLHCGVQRGAPSWAARAVQERRLLLQHAVDGGNVPFRHRRAKPGHVHAGDVWRGRHDACARNWQPRARIGVMQDGMYVWD